MAYIDLTDWAYGSLGSAYSSSYSFLKGAIKLVYDSSSSTSSSYAVYAEVSPYISTAQSTVTSANMFFYKNVDSPSWTNYETKQNNVALSGSAGFKGTALYWSVGTFTFGQTATSPQFRTGWFGSGNVGDAFTDNVSMSFTFPAKKSVSFSTTPQSGSGSIAAISSQQLSPTLSWNTVSKSTDATYVLTLPTATSADSSYTFIGWTVNGTDYNAGDSVTFVNDSSSATVYPRFRLNAVSFSTSINGTTVQRSNVTIGSTL